MRRFRFLTALVTAAAMLFSQLAVANHPCPGNGDMAAAMDALQAAGEDASSDASLCRQHCAYGKASVDLAKPAAASPDAFGTPLRVPTLESLAVPGRESASGRVAQGPPPPLIRFTVLRI